MTVKEYKAAIFALPDPRNSIEQYTLGSLLAVLTLVEEQHAEFANSLLRLSYESVKMLCEADLATFKRSVQ